MTRAVIRIVLCGAIVCLTAPVAFAQTTIVDANQEVSDHRGRWQHARGQVARRHARTDGGRRLPLQRRREDLSVRELKAGMSGTANITTTTTYSP